MASAEEMEAIKGSKVLMVGAGGIGCELLKTLALTGFKDVHVIDMDTIEVSNLNRQFLFRKVHVGQSKAKVAREAILKFKPDMNIVAYHANVKDPEFNVDFFKQFNAVVNGLDNLDARRHVNRLCLAAEVPLVESGTTGYLGQVTVHVKGQTECYECQTKPAPKTYPVCTITSTPSKGWQSGGHFLGMAVSQHNFFLSESISWNLKVKYQLLISSLRLEDLSSILEILLSVLHPASSDLCETLV